mmetsp:Transcript_28237/g.34269  ORF Transcript_28237/g.34269 Transcript_28237/m.34269 type:complete len:220 (+) Transcript_28237:281-940(+)
MTRLTVPLVILLILSLLVGESSSAVTVYKAGKSKSKVIELTDDNFDAEIAKGPMIIKVYADWCSHCRALVPIWEELVEELEGEVSVGQVNGPSQKALQNRLSVKGYPAIFLFRNGKTWEYNGSRGIVQLSSFARTGWQTAEALPFYKSPNSFVGKGVGLVSRVPVQLEKAYHVLHHEQSYSNLTILGGMLMFPLFFGILFICCIDQISVHSRHSHTHVD